MFIEIIEAAAAVAVIGGATAYFVPSFRTTIGVLFGRANKAATTPIERQKYKYEQLVASVNSQLTAVASVQATAVQAGQDVNAAKAEVDKLKGQYKAVAATVSPEAKLALAQKITRAEAHYATTMTAAEAAHKASEQAVAALNTAREQLADAADTIESNEQKAEVAKVLNTAASVSEQLSGINSKLGDFNKGNREIDHDLLTAQQRLDNTKGSSVEQELAAAQKKADAEAAMARLDAEMGTTPPAAQ